MRRFSSASTLFVLVAGPLLFGCGGGGGSMTEEVYDDGTAETTSTDETSTDSNEGTPVEAQPPSAEYRANLTDAVTRTWTRPNRPAHQPRRIAVVVLHIGPRGGLVRWEWRRRSPDGYFNESVEEHLNQVQSSRRSLPLPAEGGGRRQAVLEDGVAIELADPP